MVDSRFSSPFAPALVAGFATAVGLWCLGFLARLPPAIVPSGLLLALMIVGLLGGAAWAGRHPQRGLTAGIGAGLVACLVNLLILGSLLSGDEPNRLVPTAIVWIPGFLGTGAVLGALGAAIGRKLLPPFDEEPNWNGILARVGALATGFLVLVGGLVTSFEAGLAVVDWPNSYGYNMFLYPLSRMVGGIYYEHAHRLFGSLVGLTTVALAIRLAVTERRGWVKTLGALAVVLVVGQGILGGLRVTGHFTWSDSADVTRPSLALAMVHGVGGQIFFALMVAIAAITSRTWRERRGSEAIEGAATEHSLSQTLVILVIVQLVLGVRTRHTGEGLLIHLTFAVVLWLVAMIVGFRTRAKGEHVPALRKTAAALLGLVSLQVVLGGLAMVVVSRRAEVGSPPAIEVIVTTLHQTLGALVFANTVLLALWCRHLLRAESESPPVPTAPTPVGITRD